MMISEVFCLEEVVLQLWKKLWEDSVWPLLNLVLVHADDVEGARFHGGLASRGRDGVVSAADGDLELAALRLHLDRCRPGRPGFFAREDVNMVRLCREME